jgi:2-keto-4-pentenoate hydratase/2-oxohepta-3-ene-1,7-dioic acid hydratase in catechol pathway
VTSLAKPGKIVAVGKNYLDHVREMGGSDAAEEPILFMKPPSAVIGDGEPILLPAMSTHVDYEGELVAIIGARLRHASPDEALRGVAGYCCGNDVTARDLQAKDGQWTRAKGFDTFCPIGPMIDAPADLSTLTVTTRVNGEPRQHGLASDMVFSIPMLLSYISGIMTLEPGDVVATGTPEGVGPLQAGDVVEVIVGTSALSNRVVA